MQEYPVRRGHAKKTDLPGVFRDSFREVHEDGEWLAGSFGAMTRIRVRYDGSDRLAVDTETDRKAAVDVASETIRAWNRFLEAATGYTSKQRAKKVQETAKKAA